MTSQRRVAVTSKATDSKSLAALLSAAAVRQRCRWFLEAARAGTLKHFVYDDSMLDDCVQIVAQETRTNYPDLVVPYHSRWRHFETPTGDLSNVLLKYVGASDHDRCRAELDLVFVSVLLDAGAGGRWQYRDDDTGMVYHRSEGLAVASIRMFVAGLFSSDPASPCQVDSDALIALDVDGLESGFKADDDNRLPGLAERTLLLNRLGGVLAKSSATGLCRPSDWILDNLSERAVTAEHLLAVVLDHLNPIWPQGRIEDGVALGDVGYHPLACSAEEFPGLVPFHKLSQWLTYSLIEPLARGGIEVCELNGLTGLAEYRNGGLFVDCGVIQPDDAILTHQPLDVASEIVVEWRALTVALLDEMVARVRQQLAVNEDDFPLACLLQGGSWSAGRRLAQQRRPDGSPPLRLHMTGTVF